VFFDMAYGGGKDVSLFYSKGSPNKAKNLTPEQQEIVSLVNSGCKDDLKPQAALIFSL
jgi:hypothetical protein